MSDKKRPWLLDGEMYQYNLGWLIDKILGFETDLATAIDLKTIKYADPIQWDITTQYTANTVVIDPKTGTAYMSKVPVPAGVALDNTNYWVVIFNFLAIYNKIMDGIASNEGENDYASKDYLVNDLLWYSGILYRVTRVITKGSKFIPDTNLVQTTIESCLESYYGKDRMAQVANDTLNVSGDYTINAGDIAETADNITVHAVQSREIDVDGSDSVRIDGASTINVGGLRTEAYAGDKSEKVSGTFTGEYKNARLKTESPSWFVEFPDKTVNLHDIGITDYINVKTRGAYGDGSHDDTEVLQSLINDNAGKTLYFPSGTYMVSETLLLPDNTVIIGEGMKNSVLKMIKGSNRTCISNTKYTVNAGKDNHNIGDINIVIKDIALNGNYKETPSNAASATNNTSGSGIALYGGGITLSNVFVENFPDNGIIVEWNTYFDGYTTVNGESRFLHVVCKWNGKDGFVHKSHDSIMTACVMASNSRSAHNTYSNLKVDSKGNLRIANSHCYSDYGVPKAKTALEITADAYQCNVSNCHIEGGASQALAVYNGFNQFDNCYFYASFGDCDVLIGEDHQYFTNCMFGSQVTGEGTETPTWLGAFKFVSDKGRNICVRNGILNNTPLFINAPTIVSVSTWDIRGYNNTNLISNKCANFDVSGVNGTDIITIQGDFGTQSEYYYRNNTYDNTLNGFPAASDVTIARLTGSNTVDLYTYNALVWGTGGTVKIAPPKKGQIAIIILRTTEAVTIMPRSGSINNASSLKVAAHTPLILIGESDSSWVAATESVS